jgi:hypothetical protein
MLSCFRLYLEVHVWSVIHHTSYMDFSIQAKTRQYDPLSVWITLHTWTSQYKRKQDNTILYPMDKGSYCLVFACIEKCMYEVWFTWITDRVVLFSLVLISPRMKCALHTWTSKYKQKQDNTILYPCESHFIRGLLNTSENKTTRSVIHVNRVIHMDKGSYCLVFACIEKSMYEVWFTWIKDRVVLFSLVLRSACMKCDSHG